MEHNVYKDEDDEAQPVLSSRQARKSLGLRKSATRGPHEYLNAEDIYSDLVDVSS